MMPTPTTPHRTTRRLSALTGRGLAVVLLARVRDGWLDYTPSQRAEVTDILEQLAIALKREHSVASRQPSPLPLLGRIVA